MIACVAISANSAKTLICRKVNTSSSGKTMLGVRLTASAAAAPRIPTAVSLARRIVPARTGSGSRIAASRVSIASESHCAAATSAVAIIARPR